MFVVDGQHGLQFKETGKHFHFLSKTQPVIGREFGVKIRQSVGYAVAGNNQPLNKFVSDLDGCVKRFLLLYGELNQLVESVVLNLWGCGKLVHGEFDGLGMKFLLHMETNKRLLCLAKTSDDLFVHRLNLGCFKRR